jgi:hypothetical protein
MRAPELQAIAGTSLSSRDSFMGGRAGIGVFVMAFVSIWLLGSLWALATPIFAAPDENAHAAKAIALVHGEISGHAQAGSRFPVVDLPDSYRYSPGIVCFAYHPEVAADCAVALGVSTGTAWFDTWVSSYNPIYYYLVGWPSLLLGGSAGIYGMRLTSAALCALFVALAFRGSLSSRSRWAPAALAFLAAPMVMFLSASISPQGLEVASAAALWVALPRLLDSFADRVRPPWTLWATVVGSAAAVALARATGPLWVLIVVGACLVIAGRAPTVALFRHRSSYPWISALSAAGIFSVAWTVLSGSTGGQANTADVPLVHGSFLAGAWAMVRNTPRFVQESAGVFGWLDTPLPGLVYAVYFGAAVLLVGLAWAGADRRGRWAVLGVLALAAAVPIVVQAATIAQTGLIWQGRYGMFLYIGVMIVAGRVLSRSAPSLDVVSGRVSGIIIGLLAAFQIAAYVFALRRYVIGTDRTITQMISAPSWQPPGTWPVLVAALVVTELAMAVWLSRLANVRSRSESIVDA